MLERLVRGQLLGTLNRIRDELPDLFDEQLESGFVLNVTLAEVQEGIALLEIRDFYAETAADGSLQLRVARVSCPRECPRPTEVFGVGETSAMMRHLGTLPDLPARLPALAEELVRIEIADRPALVGPPVDVLRAGHAGVEWLRRKPACAGYDMPCLDSPRSRDRRALPAVTREIRRQRSRTATPPAVAAGAHGRA